MPRLGMFKERGALLRSPGGNVENIGDQASVIRWAALNVGAEVGGDPSKWDHQRTLYASAGIPTFPWLHCRKPDDVDFLVSVGEKWDSPAIGLNIEDVEGDFRQKGVTLADIAQKVSVWDGEILMPTLAWIQNGQGWASLKRAVAALEIFADELPAVFPDRVPDPATVQQLVDHAFAEGLTKVTLMYKTGSPNLPEHYDFSFCHSLFTADDITPTPQAWAAWEHHGKERPPMPATAKAPKKSVTKAVGDTKWHKSTYPQNPRPPEIAFVRPLFPPDSAAKGKTPSDPGPDVLAIKRAISRAQRLLPWAPGDWDDTYDDLFAHGEGTGIDRSGIKGFQRQMGIRATGWMTKPTFEALRTSLIPAKPGLAHAGEPLFDATCLRLLEQAAELQSQAEIEPLWTIVPKMRRAKHDSGPRTASSIKHIVIHSTEGGTASSNASFFATTAEASTQLVIDDKEVWRTVPDLVIPWGAPGVNSDGLHIEHAGFAKWSRDEWLSHDRMLRLSAANAAKWAWQYKIPRRWLTVDELKTGTRGFCCHVDATKAFPNNSGHSDPGLGFPRDVYMGYVNDYYAALKADRQL
jgi:N-acetylmuramoyl-L-alanine amidase